MTAQGDQLARVLAPGWETMGMSRLFDLSHPHEKAAKLASAGCRRPGRRRGVALERDLGPLKAGRSLGVSEDADAFNQGGRERVGSS